MITIACVYWKDPSGSDFPDWWVSKLQEMVSKHVTVPYRFVCLSNTNVPCEKIELEDNLPGWWSKIELFRPGLFNGRVFYLDLDTLIVDNIDDLLELDQRFIGLRPFNPTRALWPSYFASGLMSWEADGDFDFLYEEFREDQIPIIKWDQEYLSAKMKEKRESVYYWQELVDGIYSFKRHINKGKVTTPPKVICFHGKPRPWNLRVYENIING